MAGMPIPRERFEPRLSRPRLDTRGYHRHMTERSPSRSVAVVAAIAAVIVGSVAAVAVWSQATGDTRGDPRDTLLRAVEELAATERFTATTEYTPYNSEESSFLEVVEFDGAIAPVRLEWSTNCYLQPFEEHWLGRFGSPIEFWTMPGAEPHSFRWVQPGSRIEFDYLDLSIDSRITVQAIAWIGRDGKLVRVERDTSDEIGFQGTAVTTFDFDSEPTCV